ncbi:hypothetical protein Mal52_30380 [Symmachiella dynata]|uniref:Uncharacterized protein n=1 Tax=Symmachiella dynata TaxID=2527995 RepID=A0A517ZPZ9_9PLAN|nr:hypothetical protein [Symmachiella dynata]QDU44554.1 hypothetical protein Mal52_30380 [Symmachiella dynata]
MTRPWFQRPTLVITLFATVALGDLWMAWTCATAIADADAAEAQLEDCAMLAAQIKGLRTAPVVVEEDVRTSASFNHLCEMAATEIGLKTESIVEIAPHAPRRINDSPYLEQVTDVELRQVTLRQLIEFALAIHRLDAGLHASSIAVRIPPGEEELEKKIEMWNVQLALTTYIYEPKLPASP